MAAWSPERWRRIEPLLDEALDVAPAEREALLARACGDDADLLRDVRRALEEVEDAGDFLDRGLAGAAPELLRAATRSTDPEEPRPGDRIGPWRIRAEAGRGGMSTVWRVTRTEGEFGQEAALKVIRGAAPGLAERFAQERRTLARLEHPNVARLIDGGTTPDGLPYLVMEFVPGEPVTEWCRTQQPGVREILDLFLQICGAVSHAHRRLIVHRDLKPSNILVTRDHTPKLLDFGIAKWLESDEDTLVTRTGSGFHTPQYASPEQIAGEEVTTASDVYSLGLILYEMLAGARPYDLAGRPVTEQVRLVREADCPPPSEAAACRERARQLRGDLDNVVQTALRKEPERRYAGVDALAEDLRLYLRGLPIRATPDTTGYRISKFVQRNRLAVAAWGVAGVALLGGLGASVWQARAAAKERDIARQEAHRARLAMDFVLETFDHADPYQTDGQVMTAADILDRGVERLDTELADEPEVRLTLMNKLALVLRNAGKVEESRELAERSVALATARHGEQSLAAAKAEQALGLALATYGDWEKSQFHLERALEGHRRNLGPQDRLTGLLLDDVAIARARNNDAEGALRAAQASTEILQLHEPGPSQNMAIALAHLAVSMESNGDVRADSLFAESVAMWEASAGEYHPGLASTINNWAIYRNRQGDYRGAEELYRRIHDTWVRQGRPEDLEGANIQNNLGSLLLHLGRTEEAETLLRESLRILESGDHGAAISRGAAQLNLGHALLDQGRVSAARERYTAGREAMVSVLGGGHRYARFCDALLARCDAAEGRLPSAERVLADVTARLEEELPVSRQHLARVCLWHGQVQRALGRPEEAAATLRRATELIREQTNAETVELALTLGELGRCEAEMGRRAEARQHLTDAARILETARGAEHPSARDTARELAELE